MIDLYFYLKNLAENGERGQTMAEYAVVLGVISVATVGVFRVLAGEIAGLIEAVLEVVG